MFFELFKLGKVEFHVFTGFEAYKRLNACFLSFASLQKLD
jgi:hypothetical protein